MRIRELSEQTFLVNITLSSRILTGYVGEGVSMNKVCQFCHIDNGEKLVEREGLSYHRHHTPEKVVKPKPLIGAGLSVKMRQDYFRFQSERLQ